MNAMERVLADDLARLIDRLAASVPEGAFGRICTTTPTLRARLDQLDTTLAATRGSLVEAYERWARALDDLENVWALAAWRSAVEEPAENAPRLAA
jgi:outer membrane murein-binding lipoprotein Lpp